MIARQWYSFQTTRSCTIDEQEHALARHQHSHPYMVPEEWPDDLCPLDYWQSHQPPVVPRGWSVDWLDSEPLWTWFCYYIGSSCWDLHTAYMCFGTPIPLLFDDDAVFFKCGGLFFFLLLSGGRLVVVNPIVTLDEILARMADENVWATNIVTAWPRDHTAEVLWGRFSGFWHWERRDLGRDRWKEFEARGGQVNEATYWKQMPIRQKGFKIWFM